MASASTGSVTPVDKFYEFSLLGLLASGFLAVAGSGFLDRPTVIITVAALVIRALLSAGAIRFEVPPLAVTAATLAYIGFYPIDYFYLSHAFIPAAIHLVFFVAVVKILTGRTNRDYLILKLLALLELLAACLVSARLNFFAFLLLFLILGVATFASGEIRQSAQRGQWISRTSAPALSARLTGVVFSVSLGILLMTAGLFFFLPRTARAAFQHLVSHRYHLAGFSNHVTLGEIGEIKKENVPVMHIKMDRPEDRTLALKWRGAALTEFNGRAWFNRPAPGELLRPEEGRLLRLEPRLNGGREISYAVYLSDLASEALFFAGTPQFMRIDSLVVRRPFGNYSVQFSDARNIWYEGYSRLETPLAGPLDSRYPLQPLTPEVRSVYLQLPAIDPRIRELARDIAGEERAPALAARRVENYLRTHYGYTLDLPAVEPMDPLAFFLFQRKKGHCEYFASAMAVMLRTLDIPSRVVTGFQSGVYNPISESTLIRTSDAHSWVEAWMPDRGWTTFDPTPPDPNPQRISIWTRFSFYADAAEVFWQDWVLNYNLDRQLLLASRVGESSRRIGWNWGDGLNLSPGAYWNAIRDFGRRYGFLLLGVLLLALMGRLFGRDGWRWLAARRQALRVQRGEAEASDATLFYQRMLKNLKRRGIEKPAWLTPQEFAQVLQEPELAAVVDDFTSAYNELRFGGNPDAAGRIVVLLERLEATP